VFNDPSAAAEPASRLRKMAGRDFPFTILSALPWERRDYVARAYGKGRIFLAGDSAHQCSPTGGLGMHMGLEEAVDLAWKLAATLEGWGGEGLLASYEAERQPTALRNVAIATRNFRTITSLPGWSQGHELPLGGNHAAVEDWRSKLPLASPGEHVKIQYCYENSPICIYDGTPPPAFDPIHFNPKAQPGARAPHAWLEDGRSILDLFGDGFALLRLGVRPPDAAPLLNAARKRNVPMREAIIGDPQIATLYERKLVLVRPDGMVAWRGDELPNDAAAIVDTARGARGPAMSARIGSMERSQAEGAM
jgi:hypothetical protein